MTAKWIYSFGEGKAEGGRDQNELLGGKGANLAEMARLGLPVPAGFTISTEACTAYNRRGQELPRDLKKQVEQALSTIEKAMGKTFGEAENPLLVSCRSGARQSMPGMMDTVLNIGLTSETLPGLAAQTGNEWFAWDSYRRLIQMYADVVMEKGAGIEPEEEAGIRRQLDRELEQLKKEKGYQSDVDLTVDDLKTLSDTYKETVERTLGRPFPDNSLDQLWGGIHAVFRSWNGKRAVSYRRIERIPDEWGTAVNVQAMVFGNMGDDSATGVAFTRSPTTGENSFYGEWLANAQGEDVVAGVRTPHPLNEETRPDGTKGLKSLEQAMPEAYAELLRIRDRLEKHFRDMQDIEFTIERGRVWILQTRTGKRTGTAAVRMAVEMSQSKLITPEDAIGRVHPDQLGELLHPVLDQQAERSAQKLCSGLPAGPGGASGQAVFTARDAAKWAGEGKRVVLVRQETSPEDIEGMRAATAILTARGGMTSHAALVARGWGKCCVVGAGAIQVDAAARKMRVNGTVVAEGDWISLNGTKGVVYKGELNTVAGAEEDPSFAALMAMCDRFRRLGIRANADTPADAAKAREFGAEGIGLFRTEHMFYRTEAQEPLFQLRKMILAESGDKRRAALDELAPHVKSDIKKTLEAMGGAPVTIRLLDPPLHEFVPKDGQELERLAAGLETSVEDIRERAESLRESNPMMGHRGVRLGITYPEVSEMQIRAIFEATAELLRDGRKVFPEIMIPVTCTSSEIRDQKKIVDRIHAEVARAFGRKEIHFLFGTMIETPRAALTAAELAEIAEFFSFGTNDLTQLTFGFSRDDADSFVPQYLEADILPADPFQTLDQTGVGELVRIGLQRGRDTSPELEVGICGAHGGDSDSVRFCHRIGLDYVSCSPYRVPIARLAAAQAAIEEKASTKGPSRSRGSAGRHPRASRTKTAPR